MSYKYIFWGILFFGIALFSSCLNSEQVSLDALHDAQIYSFSASAAYDSTGTLANAKFAIDQLNSQIFNRDSLEFGFKPKNAQLSITTAYASAIKLYLSDPDSIYFWNSTDSVAIDRLKTIEVTAQDQTTIKRYDFKLNIHQQDPDILTWTKLQGSYIESPFVEQKTILMDDTFLTFYKTSAGIQLAQTTSPGSVAWQTLSISSLPNNTIVSSILCGYSPNLTNGDIYTAYALDTENNIYSSNNGISWEKIISPHTVKALYAVSPNTPDSVLTILDMNGELKFAKTGYDDFMTFSIKNSNIDFANFPTTEFSCVSFSKSNVHSSKSYIVSGGKTASGSLNDKIWILQEDDNKISSTWVQPAFQTQGSTLFEYDDKIYLLTTGNDEEVKLMISEDIGNTWHVAESNQALPDNFSYRQEASIVVDTNNNIWIFGGISDTNTQFTDVWRGRLNRLAVN
ncbi:MAG TPA: DUF6242 domain-containing protein [Dysgonamonadaceae bacterium]|nr:DUF6242 domain-containing protein [Dysgonamonadaceae bacterium]